MVPKKHVAAGVGVPTSRCCWSKILQEKQYNRPSWCIASSMPSREGAATTRGPNFATPPPRGVASHRKGRHAELRRQARRAVYVAAVQARHQRGRDAAEGEEPSSGAGCGERSGMTTAMGTFSSRSRPPRGCWSAVRHYELAETKKQVEVEANVHWSPLRG